MRHALLALTFGLVLATQTACVTAIGIFQPENVGGPTIVIETKDEAGEPYERVLSPIENGGQLFVAANHWPRAWYRRALANPKVRVTRDGETRDYRAVPVSEAEKQRLFEEEGFSPLFYLFTGFAPREFLRLDPV